MHYLLLKSTTMKKTLKMAVFAFVLVLGSSLQNKTAAQYDRYEDRNRDISYQDFYDELSPYGQWVQTDENGYVWVPDAGDDFRPYSTNGHWVYTDDYQWMWVSDYDWGWAPFHYGRWEEDDYYGWYWVPGYEWSPAWVAWRDGGDYYGWAPLRPGINISINFNIGGYNPPSDYWCFAPRQYITSPRIYDYCVDRRQNYTIINITTIINYNSYSSNYGYRCGPRRYDAERYCGRITSYNFRDSYSPGRSSFRGNEVSFYRPNVRRDDNRQFAPRQFERYDRNNGNFRRDNGGRNDGGFRRDNAGNRDNNGGGFRRDNGPGRVDNGNRDNNGGGFRRYGDGRNDNGPGRTDNGNRDNNGGGFRRPDRGDGRTNDQPFRRGEDNAGQPQNNGNPFPDRRRIERPDNNGGQQPDVRNGGGFPRGPQPQQGPQYEPRRQDQPVRQPDANPGGYPRGQQPQYEPRRQDQPSRQPDTRGNGGGGWPQRQPAQQQPQYEPRRQEQPVQQQPRQFERRDDGNRQQGGNNGGGFGGGGGRGRGRF